MNKFFTLTSCERCGGNLKVRTMSWFTSQTICWGCAEKEEAIKKRIRETGEDPGNYEGCGSIPKV